MRKDVRSKCEKVLGGCLEAMMSQNIWPDRILRVGEIGDDPEALCRVVNDGNNFVWDGSDGPGFAQEVQSVIGVKAALEVNGQMEIQQGHGGHRAQAIALFFECQFPSGVRSEAGGAADVVLVMPIDLDLK